MKQKSLISLLILMLGIFLTEMQAQNSFNAMAIEVESQDGFTASVSIGQLFGNQISNSDVFEIQGIQQPFTMEYLYVDDSSEIAKGIYLYPNPTSRDLNLEISNWAENLQYKLYNILGEEISNDTIGTTSTRISMLDQASGVYILKILQDGNMLKSIKIIKK